MNGIQTKKLNRQSKRQIFLDFIAVTLDRISKLIKIDRHGTWTTEITQIRLSLTGLSGEFDGYRIVQISDFHFGSWMNRAFLEQTIDQVNRLKPDLVVITGDFVTYSPEKYSQDLVDCLTKLNPKDQVLAVLGNHDHWSDGNEVSRILSRSNITELNNKIYILKRGADRLFVAGVDDHLCKLDRLDSVVGKIPPDGVAILLAHEPDFADVSAQTGRFVLQLSGHAHGGQINVPLISRFLLPAKGRKYPSGLYKIRDMYLYSNRGLGTTWLNLRYKCPPEITLMTLKSVI